MKGKPMSQTQSAQTGARPSFRVYLVQDGVGDDAKASWTEIGAIWPHKDGQGGSLSLKATPMELLQGKGRIVYRAAKEKASS
jgi:hypothetical protein